MTMRNVPRIGCLGVGWIGRHRMEAVAKSGHGNIVAIADAAPEVAAAAHEVVPQAEICNGLSDLLERDLDGIMIATPSAMHAEQCIAALDRKVSVLCQKPLSRNAKETRAVVDAARKNDRLLHVDFSYRHVEGVPQLRELMQAGELGRIFRVELTFHNAYGPDKDWFYDYKRSGGGCLIDLGIHLVDMALWSLGFPHFEVTQRDLFQGGEPIVEVDRVEDFASAQLRTQTGLSLGIECSWRLHAGLDACIEARFFGTQGGAALRNIAGSFYQFQVERYRGTSTEVLAGPPNDTWGGKAAVAWAQRLAQSASYDREIESAVEVARIIDDIYRRA